MHEYEVAVLKFLKERRKSDVDAIAKAADLPKDSVLWALENLSAAGAVSMSRGRAGSATLTKEGRDYTEALPEEALVRAIAKAGGTSKLRGLNNIGLIWAKRNGWIEIRDGSAKLTAAGSSAAKSVNNPLRLLLKAMDSKGADLSGLTKAENELLGTLERRGLVKIKESAEIKGVEITKKGIGLSSAKAEHGVGALTREMIKSGSWKGKGFKGYDVNAQSEKIYPARLHPMREFNNMIRRAWTNMGFVEVDGPVIEPAFWNFDALFSRQDHPTRDMQDTFFLSNPKNMSIEDLELLKKVKKEHEKAWGEEWRKELAGQPLL
ncbi:MAG: hypothetical protein ACREBW_07060, partial [Candidatus Micrarchaeaceae archaeon]